MDWDKLRVFYAVASVGSFTHAEQTLHISHSAISRHISQLENDLKTPLFHRHARGLNLTGAGEILMETVRDIYGQLEHTKNRIIANVDSPRGPLRIAATLGFGMGWLIPRIRSFIELYPDMEVRLLLDDKTVDLPMGEADIAIRLIKPEQGDVVCTPFMALRCRLYASRDYTERHGTPKTQEDLAAHNMIVLDSSSVLPLRYYNWFMSGIMTPVLSVSNPYAIYTAVKNGIGIGTIADYMVSDTLSGDNDLQALLSETVFDIQTYFVYPVELRGTRRIQVFKKYIMEQADLYNSSSERS